MNSPTCGLRVASVVFGLICLAQLLRIIVRIDMIIGGHPISRKISAVAVVIAGALCIWLWMLSSKADKPATPAA
jgi:hypothetical protein